MTGQQLKNSILQLAIQGKLVPQDPNDEPASVLLKRIAKVKAKLIKDKVIRNEKPLAPIDTSEELFDLPIGWAWCRLGDIAIYKKGPFGSSLTKSMFVPKSSESIKVYEQKNAIQKDAFIGDYYITKEKFETMKSFVAQPNDIIVSCAGTIGESYRLPANSPVGIINQALMRVQVYEHDMADYWMFVFHYILMTDTVLHGNGSAIKNIPPFEILKSLIVPIPPINEQKRIIAKYKEVCEFVSEYDKAQVELNELNDRLPGMLKKSILQEAIMGKLVPQDPGDEPASVLLSKIRKEKEQLVKAGKLKKKDLVSTPITDEEKPFEIPESWEWCRIFDICNFANPDKRIGKYVCLDAKYLRGKSEGIILEKGNYVEANSHIILVDGENSGEVFTTPCCGYMGSTFKELIINSQPCEHYIRLFLLQLKEKLRNNKRGAAIPHLDKELFFQTLIPLPPLPEQHRIVEKIEELFGELNKAQI